MGFASPFAMDETEDGLTTATEAFDEETVSFVDILEVLSGERPAHLDW